MIYLIDNVINLFNNLVKVWFVYSMSQCEDYCHMLTDRSAKWTIHPISESFLGHDNAFLAASLRQGYNLPTETNVATFWYWDVLEHKIIWFNANRVDVNWPP